MTEASPPAELARDPLPPTLIGEAESGCGTSDRAAGRWIEQTYCLASCGPGARLGDRDGCCSRRAWPRPWTCSRRTRRPADLGRDGLAGGAGEGGRLRGRGHAGVAFADEHGAAGDELGLLGDRRLQLGGDGSPPAMAGAADRVTRAAHAAARVRSFIMWAFQHSGRNDAPAQGAGPSAAFDRRRYPHRTAHCELSNAKITVLRSGANEIFATPLCDFVAVRREEAVPMWTASDRRRGTVSARHDPFTSRQYCLRLGADDKGRAGRGAAAPRLGRHQHGQSETAPRRFRRVRQGARPQALAPAGAALLDAGAGRLGADLHRRLLRGVRRRPARHLQALRRQAPALGLLPRPLGRAWWRCAAASTRRRSTWTSCRPTCPKAFIAIEDRWFYWHFGFNPWGIARSQIYNMTHKGRPAARRLDDHPAAGAQPLPDARTRPTGARPRS